MATDKNKSVGGQESNQNWDDQNDQPASGSREPNPERFEDKNLGQGGGSAFNERHQSTSGAGSGQRNERDNVGPLDADLNDLPSEKRSGSNQTGSGLG